MSDLNGNSVNNNQTWTCVCGNTNSGNFCINCGKNRAEGEVKKPENNVPSVTAASVAAVATATVVTPQAVETPAPAPQAVPQPQYQQPVQQQYVPQQPQPMQVQYQPSYQSAAALSEDEIFNRNKKISNRFSLISLILHYGCPIIFGVLTAVADSLGSVGESIASVFVGGIGAGVVASYVLMIIARVKCRKATFGKVLMWLYIIELILEIITAIVLIIWFVNMLRECSF